MKPSVDFRDAVATTSEKIAKPNNPIDHNIELQSQVYQITVLLILEFVKLTKIST